MLEALIPYIPTPQHTLVEDVPILGPLKLQPFGPLVMLGIVLGWRQCLKYAKHKDIDEELFRDYLYQMLIVAFVISHWVSMIFYFPEQVKENPLVLLKIWAGLSSVGGFFGAFVGMVWFLKRHNQPIIVYADATIFGLLLGWCFGRAGCAVVHDHPGRIVEPGTLLAVGPWPDQTWRYDLGLLEFFYACTLCAFVYLFVDWKNKRPGWLTGLVATAYAPLRFALDFFRASEEVGVVHTADNRYLGLTPAQWFTMSFLMVGLWLLFVRRERPQDHDYAKDSDRLAREAAAAKRAVEADDDDSEEEDGDYNAEASPSR